MRKVKLTEETKKNILNDLNIPYTEEIGEAAFYGPKLDVNVKPAVGAEYTLSTCQLDFLLPRRFDLSYIDNKGEKKTPVVLHRAIFGTFDRFTAFLIEETKGALPLWVNPNQVTIIPVNNEYHLDYANKIYNELKDMNIRVKLDDRDEKLGYKMRESQMMKTPITLVLGNDERDNGTVTLRIFGKDDKVTMKFDEFKSYLKENIDKKTYKL